ncbi:MAG: PAS domain S-box protein [Pseudomonadota bacterium]
MPDTFKKEAADDMHCQRFETAAELAAGGLLIFNRDRRPVFVSRSAAELLGFTREALLALAADDIISPSSLAAYEKLVSEALAEPGERFSEDLTVISSWGRELEVEAGLIYNPAEEEIFLSLRDLSLSRIMEKELLKSNQFLRKIIINSVDGIIAADVSGEILLFNQGAGRMLGWTEEEVIGRKQIFDFLEPNARETLWPRLRRDDPRDGPAGSLNPVEVAMIDRQGRRLPVSLSLSSILEWGEEVATVGIFTDLRERVAMERALKETRDYLKNVMENAFDMIITTDLDANIVSFNRGGERILGYQREEVIGRSVEMFYPDAEERRALMRRMEQFDGAVSNYETKLKHKNGSLADISLTLSLLTDNDGRIVGTVGISKDITAQKKAQAELRATKDYLNAIVENTPDMIITTDLANRIVSFNRGAEKILGYGRAQVLNRRIEELYVDQNERWALAKLLKDQDEAVNYETKLWGAGDRVVDIDLTLSHLRNTNGEKIGTVGISKDITEKKRIEAELEQKKAELEEAQLQILHSEKMASLGKLATSVAHEINNPLGGILLFCEMILEELREDDPNRPDLIQIREQTLRCKDIVKGLLEFGRMTGTHYAFIDLNRTVEQGLALFANQALFQNIKIVREMDPGLPQIMGDASQLNQVFTNLIINAVDAMDGQGTLAIRTWVDQEAEETVIEFADTGRGIKPEDMQRLFEPFFTTKEVGEGVGLGLSTSYGIIKKHNGGIDVKSTLGQGAVFTVRLPLEGPEQE